MFICNNQNGMFNIKLSSKGSETWRDVHGIGSGTTERRCKTLWKSPAVLGVIVEMNQTDLRSSNNSYVWYRWTSEEGVIRWIYHLDCSKVGWDSSAASWRHCDSNLRSCKADRVSASLHRCHTFSAAFVSDFYLCSLRRWHFNLTCDPEA